MITRFKSALNQIKAEDELISKTEMYLKQSLKREETNFGKFINWRSFNMNKKLVVATCLAALVIGGSGTGAYAYYKTPVSYLSLDINPSVEIGVNSFDKVVEVEAYNEDGEKILEGVDVLGSNVSDAINELVLSAADNGYIAEDGSTVVSVTSETDDTDTAAELETEAENGVNEALEKSEKKAVINKDNVALARRDEARTLGITPGKLNLINKLQAVDPTATIEMYKDASVKDIMKNIKNIRKDNVKNDENLENSDENEATLENIEQSVDKNNKTDEVKSAENKNNNNNNNSNKNNAAENNKNNASLENKGQSNDKDNKVDTTKPVRNEKGNPNNNSNNSNKDSSKGNGKNNN